MGEVDRGGSRVPADRSKGGKVGRVQLKRRELLSDNACVSY